MSVPVTYDNLNIDSRFRLVNIVAQRAKDLALKGNPKIKTTSVKVTTIALEEAVSGMLDFIVGPEAKLAKEEAKKIDYKKFLEEKRRETEPEDLSELEKDLKFYLDEKEVSGKRKFDDIFSSMDSDDDDEDVEEDVSEDVSVDEEEEDDL
ncbi:MAG: DNA-directed RNA polymerase subunit omega [Nitrospirae bacterium]|nr:DNA-directed RNA polymerase subunit omega [Nitrospirota bacterium]